MPKLEPKWEFMKLQPGEAERDPHEEEFFHLTNPAEAVVREFIQNSLDAKCHEENPVEICFSFGEIAKDKVMDYFESLENHLVASNLMPQDYDNDRIPFLIAEDFGTTGLDGATGEDGKSPPKGNNFYDFWMREGMSGKGGHEGGRWGLGKTTFHAASKLRSFWGLTIRQDDHRELLVGKAMLKTHTIGGTVYLYDGYFRGDNYKPLSERTVIQDFKQRFALTRNGENGLSLVIPLPNSEISFPSVVKAVIVHYFYAIMKGILQVRFRESGDFHYIRADNIMQMAESQDWLGTPWEGTNVKELLQFVQDSISTDPRSRIGPAEMNEEKPDLTVYSFGDNLLALRDRFTKGDLLAFRIPLTIEKKNTQPCRTYFDAYLQRSPQLKHAEEFYIRSGITLPAIRTLWNRPVRGLFVAEDHHITAFLGDAEPPAHTDWNERTAGFRENYEDAARKLRFIRNSMRQIVSILDNPPQQRQTDLLKEIFYVPEPIPKKERSRTQKPGDIVVRPKEPQEFEINKKEGGFRISLNRSSTISLPLHAKVTMAYDIRRGNPFKRYRPYDFDLASSEMSVKFSGCTLMNKGQNAIYIEVVGSDLDLEVAGFDPRRDLVVKVVKVKREESNETQT